MITFHVITIFPELVQPFAEESLLKKAQEKGLLQIKVYNVRDFTRDKHKKAARGEPRRGRVDDRPFGGGLGMVMKVEPIYNALRHIQSKTRKQKTKILLFTPRGKKFTQEKAHAFSKLRHVIMICGRYEGIDERVAHHMADEQLSLGDYVLMGGEIPALAVIETTARLIPGVVGKPEFLAERVPTTARGAQKGFLEYPEYTRPEVFEVRIRSANGRTSAKQWKVPKVLLGGDHKKIAAWKTKYGKTIKSV